MRGPEQVGEKAGEESYRVRRYRCRRCGAVMTVAPTETLRYRLFSLPAIACALCLYGTERVSSREVRRRISPWRKIGAAADRSWQTLRRWLRAAAAGLLFPFPLAARGAPRELAGRVSRALMAKAPPSFADRSTAEQVVAGALHAAMGITPCATVATPSTTQAYF
jgi:transposase-like protein